MLASQLEQSIHYTTVKARKESGGIMLVSAHANYPHRISLGLIITINIWAGRVFNILAGNDRWDAGTEVGSQARVRAINKSPPDKQQFELLQTREREREGNGLATDLLHLSVGLRWFEQWAGLLA